MSPPGWQVSAELANIRLQPGERGEIALVARAPSTGDNVRRLMTAEIHIDGRSQGPISEALVTVLSTRSESD